MSKSEDNQRHQWHKCRMQDNKWKTQQNGGKKFERKIIYCMLIELQPGGALKSIRNWINKQKLLTQKRRKFQQEDN